MCQVVHIQCYFTKTPMQFDVSKAERGACINLGVAYDRVNSTAPHTAGSKEKELYEASAQRVCDMRAAVRTNSIMWHLQACADATTSSRLRCCRLPGMTNQSIEQPWHRRRAVEKSLQDLEYKKNRNETVFVPWSPFRDRTYHSSARPIEL